MNIPEAPMAFALRKIRSCSCAYCMRPDMIPITDPAYRWDGLERRRSSSVVPIHGLR